MRPDEGRDPDRLRTVGKVAEVAEVHERGERPPAVSRCPLRPCPSARALLEGEPRGEAPRNPWRRSPR